MPADLTALRAQPITRLIDTARRLGLDNAANLRKQDLVFEIARRQAGTAAANGVAMGTGVLEILSDGFGFLRSPESSYLPGADDIYVSPSQIRRFNLRTGDLVAGRVRAPKEGERYFALIKIEQVNERSPDVERDKTLFENLTPVHPRAPLALGGAAGRLLGAHLPLALGQRVLVVAEPRSGQTRLLRALAEGSPHPVMLVVLDERPEEITALRRAFANSKTVEILATTLDEPPARHLQVAEMALERARRVVEQGQDVVVLLDSLTRLANAAHVADGRVPPGSSGGPAPDPLAAWRARRVFASGRQLQEGGSLTVIATVLRPGVAAAGEAADPAVGAAAALLATLQAAANAELHLRRGGPGESPLVDIASSLLRQPGTYLSPEVVRDLQPAGDRALPIGPGFLALPAEE